MSAASSNGVGPDAASTAVAAPPLFVTAFAPFEVIRPLDDDAPASTATTAPAASATSTAPVTPTKAGTLASVPVVPSPRRVRSTPPISPIERIVAARDRLSQQLSAD